MDLEKLLTFFLSVMSVAYVTGRRKKTGRPRSMANRIKNWSNIIKIVVPIAGTMALVKRGELDTEDLAVISATVLDKAPRLEMDRCFPGENWIVKEIAEKRGKQIGQVTLDEILDVITTWGTAPLYTELARRDQLSQEDIQRFVQTLLPSIQAYLGVK